jgi:repressor LexA
MRGGDSVIISDLASLNEREARVLEYIEQSINKFGYSPCLRDIQHALEIKSLSTVHMIVSKLEEKGYLVKDGSKSRAIRLNKEASPSGKIPLLGRITAGLPILAQENLDDYISFDCERLHVPKKELFALRVSGESMREVGIMDGDIIVVRRTPYAENGQIVVAMLDDGATVKTFYREDGAYRLQPENKEMMPIICSEVQILGLVVACVRFYN